MSKENVCLMCGKTASHIVKMLDPAKFKTHNEYTEACKTIQTNDKYIIQYFCTLHVFKDICPGERILDMDKF
jgi:hypothetical protein